MIFTVGHSNIVYQKNIVKAVWKTFKEAKLFCTTDKADENEVYGVLADWDDDTSKMIYFYNTRYVLKSKGFVKIDFDIDLLINKIKSIDEIFSNSRNIRSDKDDFPPDEEINGEYWIESVKFLGRLQTYIDYDHNWSLGLSELADFFLNKFSKWVIDYIYNDIGSIKTLDIVFHKLLVYLKYYFSEEELGVNY